MRARTIGGVSRRCNTRITLPRKRRVMCLATMIGLLKPGKTTDITLDLIAKDGKLYWGPVKLTDLPPVF